MPEEKETCMNSYDLPISLQDKLKRVDEINPPITRPVGRIEYLKLSAQRAGSRPSPVRFGRGVERSHVEYAVLESDAERWGIGELQKELDALLKDIRPLVERLPAGVLRAVATQRILEGIPCGIISRRMHFSRCYVYRLLDQACDRLCQMEEARLGLKKNEK